MKINWDRNMPRWLIFSIDMLTVIVSLAIAYLLRFNFSVPQIEIDTLHYVVPTVLTVRLLSFFLFKTYAGIIRYTGTKDAQRVLLCVLTGSVTYGILNIFSFLIWKIYLVPFSIIFIDFLTLTFFMILGRFLVKITYMEIVNPSSAKTNVIVFGAGEAGVIAKRTLDRDAGTKYKVMAFVDDDVKKVNKMLEGVKIYDTQKSLSMLLEENDIDHVIIAIQNISPQRKQEIVDHCLKYNVGVLNLPPVRSWINGELSFKQIRSIRIEDLLERPPIILDSDMIKRELTGKVILITGAAGSIGSEIVRQIIPFHPKKLIMLDMAESPLYELEFETEPFKKLVDIEVVIGDVRNVERMKKVFRTFQPQIVFHAAAYKHVPMMEENPSESILTNVCGTRVTADLAMEYKVDKFIMISTDKAVNPTNIMGATKRIAEIYCQSANKISSTRFITTRFGNVLGSNGSVIPRFRKQIESGQAITVTHPDITRFFMTIGEACQLVLEASAIGKGGEIFIFDMGKSVRIADLAKKMVKLSGLELGKDIQLVYSGLRPGEKLFEELLADKENTIPTHHPKIMIAMVREYDYAMISNEIADLIDLFNAQNNEAIVTKMKQILPEYISRNSIYERIDKELLGE